MTKVEIVQVGREYLVEITYREPFEDMFEIAQHAARFESKLDAELLQARVKKAVVANFPNSPRTVLDDLLWTWTSSMIEALYKRPPVGTFKVPTSKKTLAYIKEMSQGG